MMGGFTGQNPSKRVVEIPVQHEKDESDIGKERRQLPTHPEHISQQQQTQQQQSGQEQQPPVMGPQHAAPPFHLYSQKDGFVPEHAGQLGHPWVMHQHQQPQTQGQQTIHPSTDGACEIPIHHVSTRYIPVNQPQHCQQTGFQAPPTQSQQQPPKEMHAAAQKSSHHKEFIIPVKHERKNMAPRSDSPKKQYSSPPQLSATQKPPQHLATESEDAKVEPPKQKSAEERAFEIIDSVMKEVKSLEENVNTFSGSKGDPNYKYIEEMLTRNLLKLDSVEADGYDNIRQARRNSVRMIEAALDLLELKAHANEQPFPGHRADQTAMETDMQSNGDTQMLENSNILPMNTESDYLMQESQNVGDLKSNSNQDNQLASGDMEQEKSSNHCQKSVAKDPSSVKEMVLESEIPC